jgi:6-phosphogluconolactonase (cycloisomerase 2 family)
MTALVLAAAGRAADPASLELVQTIVLKGRPGNLDHLVLDAKNQRLFVANKANNTLDVVDLKEGKLLRQIRGRPERGHQEHRQEEPGGAPVRHCYSGDQETSREETD